MFKTQNNVLAKHKLAPTHQPSCDANRQFPGMNVMVRIVCIGGDTMQLFGATISVISSSRLPPVLFKLAFCGNFMVQLFQGKSMRVFSSEGSPVLRRWLYTEHTALCVLSPFCHIKCSNKFFTCYIPTRFLGSISGATFYIMMLPQHWIRSSNACSYGVAAYAPLDIPPPPDRRKFQTSKCSRRRAVTWLGGVITWSSSTWIIGGYAPSITHRVPAARRHFSFVWNSQNWVIFSSSAQNVQFWMDLCSCKLKMPFFLSQWSFL